ncbi:hypothetical protein ACWF94_12030 [Streptomyces sp. NPDC055078]
MFLRNPATTPLPAESPAPDTLVGYRNAGLAAVLILLICAGSFPFTGLDMPPTMYASDETIIRFFADHRTALLARSTAFAFSAALLLWFASGLGGRLTLNTPARTAGLVRGGLTVIAAALVVMAAVNTAVVLSARDATTAAPLYRFGVLLYAMQGPVVALSAAMTLVSRTGPAHGAFTLLTAAVHLALPVMAVLNGTGQELVVLVMAGIGTLVLWLAWSGLVLAHTAHTLLRAAARQTGHNRDRGTGLRTPPP